MAAIFFGPGHADPAALADPLGKAGDVAVLALRAVRIEGAARHLFGEEGADFLAQLFAFARQADRIETEGCGHLDLFPRWSARGNQRTQFIGPARRDARAQVDRPIAFITKNV